MGQFILSFTGLTGVCVPKGERVPPPPVLETSSNSHRVGMLITGILVGFFGSCALIGGALYFIVRRRRRRASAALPQTTASSSDTAEDRVGFLPFHFLSLPYHPRFALSSCPSEFTLSPCQCKLLHSLLANVNGFTFSP